MSLKITKLFIILIFILTAILTIGHKQGLLASKGKDSSSEEKNKNKELIVWHTLSSYNKEVLKNLTKDYSTHNPLVSVRTVFYSNDKDMVINLMKKDSLPDIVLISTQYIEDLAKKNILVDLSKLIPRKEYQDIDKRFWKPVELSGGIYGFPFMYDVFMLFVNQNSLWDIGLRDYREPTNWEEIEKIASKIHYLDTRKWGIFIPLENIEEFSSYIKSYTGEDIVKEDSITVNGKSTIRAMQFLQNLIYQRKIMPPKTTLNEAQSIFLSGKLSVMMSLSSNLVYTTSNFPYNLDVWKMPAKEGGTYIKSSCLAIIKKNNSKNEKDAFDLIEFLVNKENSIKWFTHTGVPPLKKSIKDSLVLLLFYENNPNYSISMFELDRGRVFPKIKHYYEINEIIKNAVEEIMINGESPGESLDKAQNRIESLK